LNWIGRVLSNKFFDQMQKKRERKNIPQFNNFKEFVVGAMKNVSGNHETFKN
jgi:hypothetical protein